MGMLVEGEWRKKTFDAETDDGHFVRRPVTIRDWIQADGSTDYAPAAGRYHLYVSNACPWAHRALIFRALKGLTDMISVSVVDPLMLDEGWVFNETHPDHINGLSALHEVYVKARPDFTGRVTVPVLWDRERATIVNNESSEIIRMFNSEFDGLGARSVDFYPEPLRAEIDEVNAVVYETVNNGVYRAGFASTQAAYEDAVDALFATLDMLEARLEGKTYLVGEQVTEADWRLFTTLVRFDPVYHTHFKCNVRRLIDYPNLWAYARRLYAMEGVAETVDMDHIKNHYYESHRSINPFGIVPRGPALTLLNQDIF